MKFLLDVCAASRSMQTTLTALGHDVMSAVEHAPWVTDEELLVLAWVEEQILITEDKDFGELVFVRRLPHMHHPLQRYAGRGEKGGVPGVAREGVIVGRSGQWLLWAEPVTFSKLDRVSFRAWPLLTGPLSG